MKVDEFLYENGAKFYLEDLSKRDFLLEGTSPYRFEYKDYVIEESHWGEMLRSFSNLLIELFPNSVEKLLTFKPAWSNQYIFDDSNNVNRKKVINNLYVNCNHTALHLCWIIQDLINEFGISPNDVILYIHRPQSAEPKQILQKNKEIFKNEFTLFLKYTYNKGQECSNKIIRNIEKYLNPMLKKISKSYFDLCLFDGIKYFLSYDSKIRELILYDRRFDDRIKKHLNMYMDLLKQYYKTK